MLETTSAAKFTLQEFWRAHVREVASFDEVSGGQGSNRLTLHAIGNLEDGGSECPGDFAKLLQTP